MRAVIPTRQFSKDSVKMRSRGHNLSRAHDVITRIQTHGNAEAQCRPHKLTGEWKGYLECHIGFDWLLIYTVDDQKVTLWRTGTHNDLFG